MTKLFPVLFYHLNNAETVLVFKNTFRKPFLQALIYAVISYKYYFGKYEILTLI